MIQDEIKIYGKFDSEFLDREQAKALFPPDEGKQEPDDNDGPT